MTKGLILITGINGYIAAVTAAHFLRQGYSVRGTVRSLPSANPLTSGPLKPYHDAGTLTITEVPDITVPGAFDAAATGVTAILHLASPVSLSFTDPDPILHAAQNGTNTLLTSALHASTTNPGILKTVVLMSSIAATVPSTPPPYTITEADWNITALDQVSRLGNQTPGPVIYAASKTAAEREFWSFRDAHNPPFSMTAVNPVFVIGAPLIAPTSPEKIPGTIRPIWAVFSGAKFPPTMMPMPQVVAVGDVARLLRFAVEKPGEANGERYIASSAVLEAQVVADMLRREFPGARGRIREGVPGEGYRGDYQAEPEKMWVIDGSKAEKAIGGYMRFEDTVVETARAFEGLL
ncbi:NAD(P)-binding protein [Corynespora cassiicola Philippines]|uniref:NAD(P)-binding protein n=1 Tax=Corynespora cassiicola Philippines TaxID=1448308 RepID=A0A2T2NBN5_CORCC|nr:NAD(P)-binding protein [Corynespora cassiicola Philippines]